MLNRRKQFFSERSVSLFQESSCSLPFLNGYGIFWKSTCSHELPIYNVFDRYFYLNLIVILKEHLQPNI